MIKKLKRALGARRDGLGVIGRVDRSLSGNSVIEVGRQNDDESWTKLTDGGHITLDAGEREELIGALESHRDHHLIKVGDVINGAHVIAVQYVNPSSDSRELRGTVLAYNPDKREWTVLTASPQGDLNYGTRTPDQARALNAFSVRTTEHLYLKFNTSPPALTFAAVAEPDRLTSGT